MIKLEKIDFVLPFSEMETRGTNIFKWGKNNWIPHEIDAACFAFCEKPGKYLVYLVNNYVYLCDTLNLHTTDYIKQSQKFLGEVYDPLTYTPNVELCCVDAPLIQVEFKIKNKQEYYWKLCLLQIIRIFSEKPRIVLYYNQLRSQGLPVNQAFNLAVLADNDNEDVATDHGPFQGETSAVNEQAFLTYNHVERLNKVLGKMKYNSAEDLWEAPALVNHWEARYHKKLFGVSLVNDILKRNFK